MANMEFINYLYSNIYVLNATLCISSHIYPIP